MPDIGKTILLVDNDLDYALHAAERIQTKGFRVVTANNGEAAVGMVEKGPQIDLVIISLDMESGIDGIQAAETILQSHDLPLLFLAAHLEPETIDRTGKLSHYGLIPKNAGAAILLSSINTAFRLHSTHLEIKTREQLLKESEEKFSKSFHITPLSMAISLASDRRYIEINDAFLSLTGYSREEVIGRTSLELGLWTDTETKTHVNHEIATAGEAQNVPVRLRTKSGEIRDAIYSAAKVLLGGVPHVVAQVLDITDRKRAEEALRESEESFHGLFKNSTIGLYRTTPDGRILLANPELCRMLGFPSFKELARRNLEQEGYATESFRQAFRQEITEKGEIRGLESAWKRRDGTILFVRESAHTVRDAEGSILYYEGTVEDITERKRAEEALRESETQYRKLIETMQDGVYKSSHEGKFLEVNPAIVKMLGYDSKEELLAIDIKSQLYFAPQDRESAALDEQLSEMGVFRLRKKDGSEIWVEDHGRHVVDDEGTVLYHEGVLRDITERKRAEHQNTLLAQTLKSAKDCISITDLEDSILFVNDAFLSTYGHAEADLLGQKISIVRSPKVSPNEVGKILPATLEGGWHGEVSNRRKDGTEFPVELWTTLVRDATGIPIAMAGAARDITERKRAEQALRESEEKYRKLIETMLDGVYKSSHEGKFLEVNPAIVKMLGYDSKEELLAIDIKSQLFFTPEDRERAEKLGELGAFRLRKKDGSEIWVEDHGLLVVDDDGTVLYHEGILRDISERKKLEERIHQVRSDLLFAVSHDLKTPLMALNQSQEMLSALEPGEALARFQEYRQIWQRNLQRLERMINNLVDSQRSEEDRFPLLLAPCNPTEIVKRVVEDLTGYALALQVQFDLKLEPVPQGSCDQEAITRVVENLLTNAVKFSPKGGQVEVCLWREDKTLLLEVEDHGAGIPANEQKQLFQPFQRGRSAERKGIRGTGLGLYVCRRIVEEHGGTISLRSEEGVGTTVTVRLPLRE